MSTPKKRKRKWISKVLVLCLLWTSTFCAITTRADTSERASSPGSLYAYAGCLYDAAGERVLYETHGTEQLAMASTTKIMTLIVLLENAAMDEIVTVSSNAARQPDVQLNINTGEQYYLKDLLYSLMLESHNDTAVALAEHVGGTVEGFCTMMNQKAAELGLTDTSFATPNGLDAENHYTTAVELAKIAAYALKNEDFIKITNTASYQFNELTKGRSFTVTNKNRFLYMMEGAIGMKTGFTNKAGYCFVGALRRNGYELVSVVLASGWPPNKEYKWSDTKKLMQYGLEYYKPENVLADSRILMNDTLIMPQEEWTNYSSVYSYLESLLPNAIPVYDGVQDYIEIRLEEEGFVEELLLADWEDTEFEFRYETTMTAPVLEGTQIGTLEYRIDGVTYATAGIYTAERVAQKDFAYCIGRIIGLWSGQS
ncbi:MAG: D-alanyl-D-alanine carboxypeptidase [Lachnospiraceae bacterium]|nr:D-alanyl-D-alanine carboxypeptidase [Lachnospiraceae bacterium]